MDVMSGCDGSSENVARQIRWVSSGQDTVTALSLRTTVTGPGRTAVRSSGTDTAGVCSSDTRPSAASSTICMVVGAREDTRSHDGTQRPAVLSSLQRLRMPPRMAGWNVSDWRRRTRLSPAGIAKDEADGPDEGSSRLLVA